MDEERYDPLSAIPAQERSTLESWEGRRISMAGGIVKSFNRTSGYGFIAPDAVGEDVWVHQRNVVGDSTASLSEGERVEFDLREGGMGAEAINVHSVASAGSPGG